MIASTLVVSLFSVASAQEVAAPVASAPPSTPLPTAVGPSLSRHTVDRHGLVVLGGIANDGDNSALRVDALWPIEPASAPRLRVGLSAQYDQSSAAIPDLSIAAYGFGVAALVLYDWRLPIASGTGDFVVTVEGGPSYGRLWLKIDQPFMPGDWQTITGVGLRAASALQFRGHNGLVISVQPLGLGIPIWHSDLEEGTLFSVSSEIGWEGALLCGFQFR